MQVADVIGSVLGSDLPVRVLGYDGSKAGPDTAETALRITSPRALARLATAPRSTQPWARAAAEDATFKGRDELEAIYIGEQGLKPGDDVIAYCRIGERSSHTWFVLTYLLGFENVRNYDGSWTEWGNTVRVPIVKGEEPGSVAQH